VEPLIVRSLIVAALLGVLTPGASLHAQPSKPRDNEVKAAYLFNFGRFVTWTTPAPAAESDLFAVCVLGRDPFGAVLDTTLAGETINGLRVAAKRIVKPADAHGCRILFVGASEDRQLPAILQAIASAGVLTVSDMPDFLARGGMIQFVSQDNRIRFEVNLTAVEQANLVLSSELLKVASNVRRNIRTGA
jgi:hypothetical protein